MRVRILYHDHCFDGAASAAFFSRFVEAKFYPGAQFAFTGLAHKADQLFEPGYFDGDVNAIVDFKYSTDPRLTWWFDHHQSAFLTPEDAEHFKQRHQRPENVRSRASAPAPNTSAPSRATASVSRRRTLPSWSTGPTSSTARNIRTRRKPWSCAPPPRG